MRSGRSVERSRQRRPAGVGAGVGGDVAEAAEEARRACARRSRRPRRHGLAGQVAEFVVGEPAAGDADDARPVGHLPGGVAVVERRQQLAAGEVAGGAEDDEVERIDRDHARGHARPLSMGWVPCQIGDGKPGL